MTVPVDYKLRKKPVRTSITRNGVNPNSPIIKERNLPIRVNPDLVRICLPLPHSQQDQDKLANELVSWAKTTQVFDIKQFAISKDYGVWKFKRLGEKNAYFKEAYDQAQAIILMRWKQSVWEGEGRITYNDYNNEAKYYDPERRQMDIEKEQKIAESSVNQLANLKIVEIPVFHGNKQPISKTITNTHNDNTDRTDV